MSIRERKLASGAVVYDIYYTAIDADGGKHRAKQVCRGSRKEARAREKALRSAPPVPRVSHTIAGWCQTWLTEVAALRVASTTLASYRYQVEHHITPALGSAQLADLTNRQVQRWVATLHATGLSRRSVEYAYRVLSMACESAARTHLIPTNPCDHVQLPRRERTERPVWNAAQARAFLFLAQQNQMEPLWTLAIATGMRRGELLALRWADIDLDASALTVRRSLSEYGDVRTEKSPKGGRTRTIPLAPQLRAYLRAYHDAQALHIAECYDAYHNDDLVCCRPDGLPWAPSSITQAMPKLCVAAGVTAIPLHSLRHTFATLALRAGQPLAFVSEILGHADRSTTIEIYQHVDQGDQRGVSDAVAGQLWLQKTQDVTTNVTTEQAAAQKAQQKSGLSLETLARPAGVEPATFRSGISGTPTIAPFKRTRKRPNRAAASGEDQAESHAHPA